MIGFMAFYLFVCVYVRAILCCVSNLYGSMTWKDHDMIEFKGFYWIILLDCYCVYGDFDGIEWGLQDRKGIDAN